MEDTDTSAPVKLKRCARCDCNFTPDREWHDWCSDCAGCLIRLGEAFEQRGGLLTFQEFTHANRLRAARWHQGKPWSLGEWAVAMMGEAGEVCNVIKKLHRSADGIIGNRETDKQLRAQLGEELADTAAALFLLADAAEVDLAAEAVAKFNEVSERHGFPDRL